MNLPFLAITFGNHNEFSLFSEINRINAFLAFESLLAAFPLASFLEKRKHFYLRSILSFILSIAIAYFIPAFYSGTNLVLDIFAWVFLYLFLMAFLMLPLLISYKGNFINYAIIASASYVIHQLFSMLDTAFNNLLGTYTNLETAHPVGYYFLRYGIYFLLLALIYSLIFFYYFKQKKEVLKMNFSRWQTALMISLAVIFAIVLSALQMIFAAYQDYSKLIQLSYYVDVFECILILLLFFSFVLFNRSQDELSVEKELLEESKKQYELSKENIESLNIKFHDFKYRIQAMEQEENRKKEFEEIYKDLAIYDSQVKTGNQALDIVLREYALRCENNSIVFSSIVDGKSLDFLSPYDIYALFGNAINNAIEAVMKIQNKEKRDISLQVRRQHGFLSIHVVNYYEEPLSLNQENGLPETSKGDTLNHGYGLKSIKLIAEKYGGHASISLVDDMFVLDVLLPLPEEKKNS